MKFVIENNKYNLLALTRRIGYHPHRNGKSFSRRLESGEFPRFHVYTRELSEGIEFSLHLDQKGACYEGHTAHSGDYDGDILNSEKERIINSLKD